MSQVHEQPPVQRWTTVEKASYGFAATLLVVFFLLVLLSTRSEPLQAERYVSLALAVVSAAVAAFSFGILHKQTAGLRFRLFGVTVAVGGAVAAWLIAFVVLQFVVRGTSSLYVELFSDDAFTVEWLPPAGQAPEFGAAMRSYSVVAVPERNNLRFFNLPMFEWVTLTVRDPRWRIAKLVNSEKACTVEGRRLSGWCTEAWAVVRTAACIEDWRGSGHVEAGTFAALLDDFIRSMRDVGYPVRRHFAIGERTRRALATRVGALTYNGQDFCTAINDAKSELERTLKVRVQLKIGCDTIGFSVFDESLPPDTDEPVQWRKTC
jgi:hypothetical protein